MTCSPGTWKNVGRLLTVLLVCACAAAGQYLASGRGLWASVPLLLLAVSATLGLVLSSRTLGRLRLRAVLDAYVERELDRELPLRPQRRI